MIDKQTFLANYGAFDASVIKEIIEIYNDEHPMRFANMADALEKNDFRLLREVVHGLKGVLSQFYAGDAHILAKNLEYFARDLRDYYNEPENLPVKEEDIRQLREMIGELEQKSLLVIEDLKDIQKSYK
jgi:HPt (histidine-containing phosphotransfer) domain-containing protein